MAQPPKGRIKTVRIVTPPSPPKNPAPPTTVSEKQFAHSGAITRAMKAHPGLTREEAEKMARDLGF